VSRKKRYKTHDSLRTPNILLLEYRILHRMHIGVNAVLGTTLLPFNALLGQFIIFCYLTLIRDWKKLDFYSICILSAASFSCMVFWIVALELTGQQHIKSRRVKDSWRLLKFDSSWEAKYFYKMRKICPVIHIGIPGTFTIKRKTVLINK
jgi:hypothetical protein